VLSPGKAPHQPHEHAEEEILIMLSGEADLVIIDTKQGQIEKRHSLRPGSFVYYPAWQWHTINNPGTQSATYLMFKWDSEQLDSNNMLETSIVQFLEGEHYPSYPSGKSFATTRVLDGGTQYLRKLHCHITTLQPGSGYPPHDDPYDVAILVLRGNLETLGQRISPNSVIFYAAGEPHDMKNVGTSPALYLVFEFHGDILDQSKNSTKLKYGNILPVKARYCWSMRSWQ
jgi:quercetin dioxygenase-like cupin family protein